MAANAPEHREVFRMYDLGFMIYDLKKRSRQIPRCDPPIPQMTQILNRVSRLAPKGKVRGYTSGLLCLIVLRYDRD
jgi:hypothetical protein